MRLWFLDFEASSLAKESYPIEVGLVALDIAPGHAEIVDTYQSLIAREPEWTDWSEQAEGLHGISRDDLIGRTAACDVARVVNELLAGQTVLSDSVHYDNMWAEALNKTISADLSFKISSLNLSAQGFAAQSGLTIPEIFAWYMEFATALEGRSAHRALADAEFNAKAFADAWKKLRF